MRITIVAMEMPYPANHGGRVDIWRRIVALSHLGVEVQLICWNYEIPSVEDSAVVGRYVKDFIPLTYSKDPISYFRRAVMCLKYPLQVTSRVLSKGVKESLLNKVMAFGPDVIMADHVHCGLLAQTLSSTLNIPYVVRSHDIEHLHYGYWMKSAKGLNRLKLMLCLWHLKPYEFSVLRESLAFYDISTDDLDFWHSQGLNNGAFLAPLMDGLDSSYSQGKNLDSDTFSQDEPNFDIVFLGNLRTENNVAGVIWFLQEVLPLILEKIPNVKVLISGSKPIQELIDACGACTNVELKANPVSAKDVYLSGKVLINPVSQGSGTSIKSIDMLSLDRPIVTLPKGVQGLPEVARKHFQIATGAQSFCDLVCSNLLNSVSFHRDASEVDNLFGYPVVKDFIFDLQGRLAECSR